MAHRDVSATGFSVLYNPGRSAAVTIIFIHGIQGHPLRTWCVETPPATRTQKGKPNSKRQVLRNWLRGTSSGIIHEEDHEEGGNSACGTASEVFWPQDLLPHECPQARILTWGYESTIAKVFKPTDKSSIFVHAKNFLYALVREVEPRQPLIFVAHSLGGIIVKELLANCETSENAKHRDIMASTSAVLFFDTPHRGSKDFAGVGEIARKAASILLDTNSAVLDSLGLKTSDLERCQDAFMRIWRKRQFRVKTFQEGSGLTNINLGLLNEKVVPDFSSKLDDPREEAEMLLGNHKDICRISSVADPNYTAVAGELRLVYQNILNQDVIRSQGTQENVGPSVTHRWVTQEETALIESLTFDRMRFRERAIRMPEAGTCTWLEGEPSFSSWLNSDAQGNASKLLWIKGSPGCGKSTIMKALMRQADYKHRIVAGFFLDARALTELERSSVGLFRTLLYQLVSEDSSLRETFIRAAYQDRKIGPLAEVTSQVTWALEEVRSLMWKLFTTGDTDGKETFVFVDALDECSQQHGARDIMMYFRELTDKARDSGCNLKVCISSRSHLNISLSNCLQIHMDKLNHGDIRTYVTRRFSLSGVSSNSQWISIAELIITKARGIFLWAVLVVNMVLEYHDRGENSAYIKKRLSDVPPQLRAAYTQILRDTREDAILTYQFFLWLVLGTQRLRLREWRHILPFIQEHPPKSLLDLEFSDYFIENDEQLIRKIRTVSRGLAEVVEDSVLPESCLGLNDDNDADSARGCAGSLDTSVGETRVVQVIHESVRHFFLQQDGFPTLLSAYRDFFVMRGDWVDDPNWSLDQPINKTLAEGHFNIMTTCLMYLHVPELDALVEARWSAIQREQEVARRKEKEDRLQDRSMIATCTGSRKYPRRATSVASFASAGSSLSDLTGSDGGMRIPMTQWRFEDAGEPVQTNETESQKFWLSDPNRKSGEGSAADWQIAVIRRFLQDSPCPSSPGPASLSKQSPGSIEPTSFAPSKCLGAYPALLYYATTQLFVHAKLAQDCGAKPGFMVRHLEENWRRYWMLREEGVFLTVEEFCKKIRLESWTKAFEQRGA